MVATLHWSFNFYFFLHILPERQRYPSIMKHGVFFLLTLFEGVTYSRIPLRAKHIVFPMTVLALYSGWTVFQSFFGPSNPFFYGQEHGCHPNDDDAVYPQLNWSKRPDLSSVNWLLALLFVVPVHYYLLWAFSCWSGGWRFDGSNRRFLNPEMADTSLTP